MAAHAEGMRDAVSHRGPDDRGIWTDPAAGVALAHRRLSIIDCSPAGHQPMVSGSGRYAIAFNGEIYNFAELRAALDRDGQAPAWRGHSDTEVLLALVDALGPRRALDRVVGMFAFALWDTRDRTLHLACDRLGEKPLYYGRFGQVFAFGSELKALRAHPEWIGEVDRDALVSLMRHSYVPAPYSIHRNVRKLRPGSLLTLRWGSPDPTEDRYWSARHVAESAGTRALPLDRDGARDELDRVLREAVRLQMVADVPLGAFLSGGVDSSTIVALMQAQSARPIRTFTIGFLEQGYDEAQHAAAVARHLGTDHTELYVTPQQARDVIPRLPHVYDEPFADSSQIPTFLVSQLARSKVTVALSGDGGDELFGGYNRYLLGQMLWKRPTHLPRPLRNAMAAAIRAVPAERWNAALRPLLAVAPRRWRYGLPGDKLHKLAHVLRHDRFEELYRDLVSHWSPPEATVIGGREPATELDEPVAENLTDPVERMMLLDLVSYLPGDILTKVDRAAMAVSLETRVPLLDHRVVEFAWRLPLELKMADDGTKSILRAVLYKYVPRALVDRPKMGFGVPIDTWLRGPLREWAEALLDEGRLRREGYLEPRLIRERWKEHLAGRRSWHYPLWNVLMFQAWLEAHGR
jgi:asparagine synthase (glutamine-hydrolysing)